MRVRQVQVLQFWFGSEFPRSKPNFKLWFGKSTEQDSLIREQFLKIHRELAENPNSFGEENDDLLAAIIVLDQFSRNMFRDTPEMFKYDENARKLAIELRSRDVSKYGKFERLFAALPFMHSEQIDDQKLCLEICEKLDQEFPGDGNDAGFAKSHLDIIARFGRFPHRNTILGRASTDEEIAFLKEPNSSF
jgi:uncharacterized protein (DUF924 family)